MLRIYADISLEIKSWHFPFLEINIFNSLFTVLKRVQMPARWVYTSTAIQLISFHGSLMYTNMLSKVLHCVMENKNLMQHNRIILMRI